MARLVIELTNRCNLRCLHCFTERHAATGDLSLLIFDTVLHEGKGCGIDHLAFTGGEPTIHRQFSEIIRRVCEAAYTFSLVSNGTNFAQIAPLLQQYRHWFTGVTFSLDGAYETTHDRLRGVGSYRRVMRAASLCVFNDLPFTLNMVLTAQNRGEVEALISVGMAPGYFSPAPFFPCAPLELEEFNLDYQGNLTLCCHLSGYSGANDATDVIGNLHDLSLAEACARFRQRVAVYLADKQARLERGAFGTLDHFPCWYCVKYLNKVTWLDNFPQHPWAQEPDHSVTGRSNAHVSATRATTPGGVDTQLEAGETALLHLESTTYYSLNPTGTHIWQGLKHGLSLQEISDRLRTVFEVDADRANRSVLAFVNELAQHQLVQISPQEAA